MAGLNVTVLEAQNIGWGASGRNGGFCCLGGGVATDAMLDKHYGREERLRYRQTEVAAISHVENMIETLGLDVDRALGWGDGIGAPSAPLREHAEIR